jgi:hypothetical protein
MAGMVAINIAGPPVEGFSSHKECIGLASEVFLDWKMQAVVFRHKAVVYIRVEGTSFTNVRLVAAMPVYLNTLKPEDATPDTTMFDVAGIRSMKVTLPICGLVRLRKIWVEEM